MTDLSAPTRLPSATAATLAEAHAAPFLACGDLVRFYSLICPPDRGRRFGVMPSIRGLQFSTPVGKKTETMGRAEASPHAAEDKRLDLQRDTGLSPLPLARP